MKYIKYFVRAIKSKITQYLLESLYRDSGSQELLAFDVERWNPPSFPRLVERLEFLFLTLPEFRSLFYHRIQKRNFKKEILLFFYKPTPTLHICTDEIGPGLFLQHGFATIIAAKRIGRNCWINQQVTIGWTGTGQPEIGDDVTICSGAQVIGGITIGDRAIIGAGAVVVKSVPPGCTVVGNPASIVKRDGVRVTEKL